MAYRLSPGLFQALPPTPCRRSIFSPRFFTSLPLQSARPLSKLAFPRQGSPSPAKAVFSRSSFSTLVFSFRFPTRSSLRSPHRAFSTSPRGLVRQTYFPRGSGGSPPPKPGFFQTLRRRIDQIPTQTIIYALIGLNIAVFFLWQYAISSYQRFRDPSLYQFLTRNFVLNENNIFSGRLWTLLTSCFSHSTGSHIFINCLGLWFVAPAAASLIGSASFLGLYLGGGIFASATSLLWHRATGQRWQGSEGASGAIYATLAFYGAFFPNTTWLLFFVVPMPAWVMIGGLFAYDCYSAVFRPQSGTDSAGHIGGILAGLLAAMRLRRRGLGQVWRGGPRWR